MITYPCAIWCVQFQQVSEHIEMFSEKFQATGN